MSATRIVDTGTPTPADGGLARLPDAYAAYAARHHVIRDLPLPEPDIKISVVIPALNESQRIIRTLEAFNHQTRRIFEVVIVDNGSTDGTQELVQNFAAGEARFPLHLLSAEQKGVGHARKRGMDQAVVRHCDERLIKYIAGTDADCIVPPTWIESIERGFETSQADFLAGEIELFPRGAFHPALHRIDSVRRVCCRFGMPMVRGAAFAIRTDSYVEVDGIKQPYSAAGNPQPGEEGTLSDGLLAKGRRVATFPDAIVTDPRRFLDDLLKGERPSDRLYGEVMTEIRNGDELLQRLAGVPDEVFERYAEKTIKRTFRKCVTEVYRNPLHRANFWEGTRQLVAPLEASLESDITSKMPDDELWKKYGAAFLANVAAREPELD